VNQLRESASTEDSARTGGDLPLLFHRLNNQLGIILACAELLELKAADEVSRTRAAEVVNKVLDAMGTAKEIRLRTDDLL
jgi:hypothetical protein